MLARELNATRNAAAAAALLRTLEAESPNDAGVVSETGRSLHLMGDTSGARAALDAAVALEPHALPAWQYLLRLAAIQGADDGPSLAERAQSLFPDTFDLTLLGAELHPASRRIAVLMQAVLRQAPKLPPGERKAAAAHLRVAIEAVAGQIEREESLGDCGPALCELAAQASMRFPASSQLSGLCGRLLHAAGRGEEAFRFEARAHALSEHDPHEARPLVWQLARHIVEVTSGAPLREEAL